MGETDRFSRAVAWCGVTVTAMAETRYLAVDLDDLVSPTGRHGRWLRRALETASTSPHRTRMGAIAVCSGRILSEGVNTPKNRPTDSDWSRTSRHAEQALIGRADLGGSTVYIARLLRDGRDGCARPCLYCLRRLLNVGVRTVVWTAGNGLVGIERITTFDAQATAAGLVVTPPGTPEPRPEKG